MNWQCTREVREVMRLHRNAKTNVKDAIHLSEEFEYIGDQFYHH